VSRHLRRDARRGRRLNRRAVTMLPNFLLIGAGKSGTSSLHAYFQQHPDIYMSPVKEPNFFALDGKPPLYPTEQIARAVVYPQIWRLEDYEAQFTFHAGQKAVGESSTWYLNSPVAPAAIRSLIPEARLIAILRDPIERAFSAFLMSRRIGLEPETDLAAALAKQADRQTGYDYGLDYLTPGLYAHHLKRYLEHFSADQLEIVFHEDFVADEAAVLARLFRFLGVDPDFRPDTSIKHNAVRPPRQGRQTSFSDRIGRAIRKRSNRLRGRSTFRLGAARAGLPADLRHRLIDFYEADIGQLETLTGRDLIHWRRRD